MYKNCPSCGEGVGGGAFRKILHECDNCGKIYCNACGDNNQGRDCPKCGKTNNETAYHLQYYSNYIV